MFPLFLFPCNIFGGVNHTLRHRQSTRDVANTLTQRPCIRPTRPTRAAIAQTLRGRHPSVFRFHELLRPNGYSYGLETRQAGAQTLPLQHVTVPNRPRASHPRQLRDCIINCSLLKDQPTARHWTGIFEWKRLPDVHTSSLYPRQRSPRFRLHPSTPWTPFCRRAAAIFEWLYLLNGSSRKAEIRVISSSVCLLTPTTTSSLHPQPLPV